MKDRYIVVMTLFFALISLGLKAYFITLLILALGFLVVILHADD